MTKLAAVLIDSNEPEWVKRLKFKGASPTVTKLHVGDAWLTTDNAQTIIVERKSASDLISSILDDGLRNQAVRIANERMAQTNDPQREMMAKFLPVLWEQSRHNFAQFQKLIAQNPMVKEHFNAISPEAQLAMGQTAVWNYLVYTRPEVRGAFVVLNGQVTQIRWRRVLGVLTDCQEMGIVCEPIGSDSEYAGTIEWLATRNHSDVKAKAHRRKGIMETEQEFFLSGLPGIEKRAKLLIDEFKTAAWALDWLSDLNTSFKVPSIGSKTKQNVRKLLGLEEDERLGVINRLWENLAGSNQEITIGDNEGHIWTDDGGMVAVVQMLQKACPDDPELKKLLPTEKDE